MEKDKLQLKISKWSEMPISVLLQINEINGLHASDEEKTFMATAILAGMSYNEFMELPLEDARYLVSQTGWLTTQPERKKVKKEYKIGKHTYVLMKDMMGICTAQYIDYQALITDGNLKDNIAEMMGIILIPKNCKYNDGYNKDEAIEEIRENMNVEEALSVADFFMTAFAKSMRRTITRLEAELIAEKILTRKGTEKKEILKAMILEMRLLGEEVRRSMSGYNWWSLWPK